VRSRRGARRSHRALLPAAGSLPPPPARSSSHRRGDAGLTSTARPPLAGTFGNFVSDLRLLLADGTILNCSHDQTTPKFFGPLFGGMGSPARSSSPASNATVEPPTATSPCVARRTSTKPSTALNPRPQLRYSWPGSTCLAHCRNLGPLRVMLAIASSASELLRSSKTCRRQNEKPTSLQPSLLRLIVGPSRHSIPYY